MNLTTPPAAIVNVTTPANFSTPVEIAAGVLWARLRLPMRLNHVNVWLLRDGEGFAVVDCGPDTEECREYWTWLKENFLRGRPITRLIVTHGHLDHIGLAGWFVDYFDCPLVTTRTEFTAAHHRQGTDDDPEFIAFVMRYGMSADTAQESAKVRNMSRNMFGPVPETADFIADGDIVETDGMEWLVQTFGGHAAEQATLYDRENGVLIAGDQILPHISPVVALFPDQPTSNPLDEFLYSMRRLAEFPADTLVLPSHGTPFQTVRERAATLLEHHRLRLEELFEGVAPSATAYELTVRMFPNAIGTSHGWMALLEVVAHMRYLVGIGRLDENVSPSGVSVYSRV